MGRKRDRGICGEYNRVIGLGVMGIVRAIGLIGARLRGRRKYRRYGRMRVGLVRISYEVVLLLMILGLGEG